MFNSQFGVIGKTRRLTKKRKSWCSFSEIFSLNQFIFVANFRWMIFFPTNRERRKQLDAPVAVRTQHNGKPRGQQPSKAPPRRFNSADPGIANVCLYIYADENKKTT